MARIAPATVVAGTFAALRCARGTAAGSGGCVVAGNRSAPVRGDPSLAARGLAAERRAQGRTRRLPRHARAALPRLSRLAAGEGIAAMAVRRADHGPRRPRVRDALRARRAALDRTPGRASAAADMERSALVARARRGDRPRAGDAVRTDAGGAAHGDLREAGRAAGARDLP